MRRAINTIPDGEYNRMLAQAAERMREKIRTMIDKEHSLMVLSDNFEHYSEAEMHDFNQRALRLAMSALYLTEKKKKQI